jgi:hypothetical protein
MAKINVLNNEIAVCSQNDEDYICITDIARYKNSDRTDDLIRNWLRNRNTIEFLGIWEQLNNPDFNPVEFDGFKKLAGLNSFTLTPSQWIGDLTKINYRIHTNAIKENLIPAELTKAQVNLIYASEADVLNMALFGMTAKDWRDVNPGQKGNIRDYADISQLVCLSNLENLNAHFINDGLPQEERLLKLNKIAIHQMKLLTEDRRINAINDNS